MLNQSGVKSEKAGTRNTILYDTKLFFALSGRVGNDGVDPDDKGRKIIKAGTPLKGNPNDRDSAFTLTNSKADVVAILEHDVDVTEGTMNGSILFFGFIDESKLDATVKAMITSDIKGALPMIKFFD